MKKKLLFFPAVIAVLGMTTSNVFATTPVDDSSAVTQKGSITVTASVETEQPVLEAVINAVKQPEFVSDDANLNFVDKQNTQPYTFDDDALSLSKSYVNLAYSSWNSKQKSAQASSSAQSARQERETALSEYEIAKNDAEVKNQTASDSAYNTYRMYKSMDTADAIALGSPGLAAALKGPEDAADYVHQYTVMQNMSKAINNQSNTAVHDAEAADEAQIVADGLLSEANDLLATAEEAEETAKSDSESAEVLKSESQKTWQKTLQELNTSAFSTIKTSLETENVKVPSPVNILSNNDYISQWNLYLEQLRNEQVNPLPVEQMLTEEMITSQGYYPVVGADGIFQPGIAKTSKGTIILSTQSIQRVNYAISNLLIPFDATPESGQQSCQTFISQSLNLENASPLSESFVSSYQNSNVLNTYPGDIVYIADAQSGIHQAGISIGGGFIVTASAASGFVTVEELAYDVLRSSRPGVAPSDSNIEAPVPVEGSSPWNCGGITSANDSEQSTNVWVKPFNADDKVSTAFNIIDETRFSSMIDNKSLMIGFNSSEDTTVKAGVSGLVVSVSDDEVYGRSLIIKNSDLISVQYSGFEDIAVKEGSIVQAGDALGFAGISGQIMTNQTPGIMISVTANNINIDPTPLFDPIKESFSEYPNGQIPPSALCEVGPVGSGHMLRCDAARAFNTLVEAYQAEFGQPIAFSDTYRSLEGQIRCSEMKGDMCATPGTSNHGWGLAVDFAGGINVFGTPEHEWMRTNAGAFGWYHPSWAQANGSKPEAWHWEFVVTQSQY